MERVLVNSDKYNGQYVALVSVDDNTIVGSGNTPDIAYTGIDPVFDSPGVRS